MYVAGDDALRRAFAPATIARETSRTYEDGQTDPKGRFVQYYLLLLVLSFNERFEDRASGKRTPDHVEAKPHLCSCQIIRCDRNGTHASSHHL